MLSKKRLIMLATVLTLGVVAIPIQAAEIADQNPPNATEDSYRPFHPNLDEDIEIIESEADKQEENQTVFEEVILDESTFPDEAFRIFIASKFDTNSDGTLQSDEIRAAKILDTEFEAYFSSTQGIEYLKNLKKIAVPMAGITSIDVSSNPKLQILDVNYNEELTSIDVSNNKELRILDVSTTKISKLDVSQNPDLKWLYCFDSPISSIDIRSNTKLKRLDMARTPITSIDVSNNPKLQALNIEETGVSSIDTNKNRDLYEFYFKETPISEVDFSKNWNLAQIWASGTKLTNIDVSHCRNLFVLYVQNLDIKEIDFSNCPNLYELFASNSSLEKLDVDNHTNLNCVEIDGTNISQLNVGKSSKLNGLSISGSKIKKLDISQNKSLKRLELANTSIQQLDISQNKELEKLYIDHTTISNLKSLDLSSYAKLQELGCEGAGIEKLILPESPDLCYLNCADNHLKELDLSKVPELWYELKYSPQSVRVSGSKIDNTVVVNFKQVVSDTSRASVIPSENYTYDEVADTITFKDPNNLEFSYSYAHAYQHDKNAVPMEIKAKTNIHYSIIDGNDQKVEPDNTLSFECAGSKEFFQDILIDNIKLSSYDYTVKEKDGSLCFEIHKDIINKLAIGKHLVTIIYTDGEASFTFEKTEKAVVPPTDDKDPNETPPSSSTDSSTSTPNGNSSNSIETGDSYHVVPWAIALIVSLSVLLGIVSKKLLRR